jgi:leader peptidase (prepilin peptidase) / N-methyltransferase
VTELAGPEVPERTDELPSWAMGLTAFGAVFAAFAAFAAHGLSAEGLVDAIGCATLVVLAAIDIHRRVLPNVIVLPATAVVLVLQLALRPEHALEWLGATFAVGGFFFLARVLYPEGLGMGDVKLGLLLGAMLGTAVIPALLLGSTLAALAGLYLLATKGSAARKMAIPFGPFLAAGTIAVALFG